MAYGFNLGQIEGLDSSVKTVTLTVANATESNTYTLTYDNTGIGDMWTDPDGSAGLYVQIEGVTNLDCHIIDGNLTSSDIGDVYNITLSIEGVEPNFKSAVEEVIEESGGFKTLDLTVPTNQILNLIQGYAYWDITSEASATGFNQDNAGEFFISITIPNSVEFTLVPNGIWGTGADLTKYPNVYSGFSLSENGFTYFVSAAIDFSNSIPTIRVFVAHTGLTPGMPTD